MLTVRMQHHSVSTHERVFLWNCQSFWDGKCLDLRGTRIYLPLQWRHNARNGVSNHQPHDCLRNRLFRCRSRKTSKLRVTGLCVRGIHRWPVNSPTVEFPAQMASNAENDSIWWRHHAIPATKLQAYIVFMPGIVWFAIIEIMALYWWVISCYVICDMICDEMFVQYSRWWNDVTCDMISCDVICDVLRYVIRCDLLYDVMSCHVMWYMKARCDMTCDVLWYDMIPHWS